jgi:hypothetical protein
LCRLRLDYFTSHTAACACRLVPKVTKFSLHRKNLPPHSKLAPRTPIWMAKICA